MIDGLPQGWSEAPLADIAATVPNAFTIGPFGSNLKVSDYTQSGVPLVFVRDIRAEKFGGPGTKYVSQQKALELASHTARSGDVLVTKMGEPPGDTAVYPEGLPQAIITADCIKLTPHPELTSATFLKYCLRSQGVRSQIVAETMGVAQQKLSLARFKTVVVPLPPMSEQRRIVAHVEALLAKVQACKERLDRIPVTLKRFRQSVLAAASSGRLTADWRTEHQQAPVPDNMRWSPAAREYENQYNRELPELPASWRWASVDEVGDVRGGIQKTPQRRPVRNARPYLRVANVLRGRVNLDEVHQMELYGEELETYRLEKDDLLVVEGNGSINEIGRCAKWDGAIRDCVHQNHIIRVRITAGSPDYFLTFWNSPLSGEIMGAVAVTTAGLYNLSTKKIRTFPIPIPPGEEQEEIAQRVGLLLSLADRLQTRYEKAARFASKLTQSVLAKAFRGELVPTEAVLAKTEKRSYETAEELLARIKQPTQSMAGSRVISKNRGMRRAR